MSISEDETHILVVDDDERLRDLLCRFLRDQSFVVSTASNAAEARAKLAGIAFDAIILDIMMPGESGLEFTKSLRTDNSVPILLLSAKGEIDDRINGLELGADDYLPKPFEPRELVARLRSILRRKPVNETSEVTESNRVGAFHFDTETAILSNDETELRLPPIEAHLLTQLLKANGDVVTRDDLADTAPLPSSPRSIDVQIGRLRKKVEQDPKKPHFIHTVRGFGYRLTPSKG